MRRLPSNPPELPGYEYQRLLGTGGFSDVFLYQQRLPRREVAVKVLVTEELTAAARKAFVDEANVMAQLSTHPYIVTIYGADVAAGDRPYFVMEYCAGPSLSELYKREPFQVATVLRTGIRIASAVATAHDAGILHRDIKPANVLTNDYGNPALTDFGIASALDELPVVTTTDRPGRDSGAGTTESQSVGMSVPWSPPEMFEDRPDPDVRSDVFSLAATIWTLLAGRTPFEVDGRSNGTLDLIGRIERGMITPMARGDVPGSLVAVLQKGMAVRREERYQSAIELARALQRVELELAYAPTPIEARGAQLPSARPDADPGAEETRIRAVQAVTAQPITPPPASRPPVDAQADDRTMLRAAAERDAAADSLDRTVLRRAVSGVQTAPAPGRTALPEEAPGEPDGTGSSARRRLLAPVIGVVAAVVVVGAVAATMLLPHPSAGPSPTSRQTGGSAIISGVVAAPAFLGATASPDGTSVTFAFGAVAGADGYRWAPSEQPDDTVPTSTPTVVRTGITPGTRVCVQLYAVQNGRTSAPTEGCSKP